MKASNRLLVIAALFVTCLITANIIAVKLITLGGIGLERVVLPAAVIVFPVSYIFGDILTEVYGYRWARRIIWLGFACNLVFVVFAYLGGLLPSAPFWSGQGAYQTILGYTPRLLLASFAGYLAGEFTNSVVLSRMKILTKGRWLWTRTIGSTIVGEGLDSVIFLTIAFIGTPAFTPWLYLWHWSAKVFIEIAATPLTYRAVAYLKKADGVDAFDEKTSYNPFAF